MSVRIPSLFLFCFLVLVTLDLGLSPVVHILGFAGERDALAAGGYCPRPAHAPDGVCMRERAIYPADSYPVFLGWVDESGWGDGEPAPWGAITAPTYGTLQVHTGNQLFYVPNAGVTAGVSEVVHIWITFPDRTEIYRFAIFMQHPPSDIDKSIWYPTSTPLGGPPPTSPTFTIDVPAPDYPDGSSLRFDSIRPSTLGTNQWGINPADNRLTVTYTPTTLTRKFGQ